jgi:primary-amine oxidase
MHPLEPLTAAEIEAAAAAIRADSRWDELTRFALLALDEPEKDVLGNGAAGTRLAIATVYDRGRMETARVSVDLDGGKVRSWEAVKEAHATLFAEELYEATLLVRADERWQAAMARRGISDLDSVQLDPWPAGNFDGTFDAAGRRVRVLAYLRPDPGANGYAKPVEGVLAIVDLVKRQVSEVHDYGEVPIPPEPGEYRRDVVGPARQGLRALEITQPDGPSFTVDGNLISWQRWRFRVSMHPLDGLVLHTVGYEDGGRVRSVLHRAALGEMVVPYGETSPMHFWKNAFDAGEFGIGRFPFLNSLTLGCDCLGEIRYLDAVMADEHGKPYTVEHAVCLHEEDYGILWKHLDMETFNTEVRRSRRLVVSSIHTVGNYEYGFFWYFYLDGSIQFEVKLTGILSTMAVPPGVEPLHATLVAPQLAGPYHQHLFNVRLDFDVDGTANTVEEVDAVSLPAGADNPYSNAWVAQATPLTSELEARRDIDPGRSRHWRIVNPGVTNRLGRPVGYRLIPGAPPSMLAGADSAIARRAGFARHHLWVTPYRQDERRAAGEYPNLHPGGAGLPEWTAADRPVDNRDIVVWYSFGLTHVPRPEDWPVMPVEYCGFLLQPFGFFEGNPAIDLAPPDHCAN